MRADAGTNVLAFPRSKWPRPSGTPFRSEREVRKRQKRERQVLEVIRARSERREFLHLDLFHEPAWDMLLALYAAALGERTMTGGSLSVASAVPVGIGLRHIRFLVRKGLFVVQGRDDDRDAYICLSSTAFEAMDRYFDHLNAAEFPDVITPSK